LFDAERKIGGQVFVAELPAEACATCGERTVGGPELLAFDAAVAVELRAMARRRLMPCSSCARAWR
jgi:hypothetical protein